MQMNGRVQNNSFVTEKQEDHSRRHHDFKDLGIVACSSLSFIPDIPAMVVLVSFCMAVVCIS
jgi:hypothetical protein